MTGGFSVLLNKSIQKIPLFRREPAALRLCFHGQDFAAGQHPQNIAAADLAEPVPLPGRI
jgi:hypothetical protein